MSRTLSPVGLGLPTPAAGSLLSGGLSVNNQSLIIDPGSDPASGGPNPSTNQVFGGLFWAARSPTLTQLQNMNTTPLALAIGTPNSTIVPLFFWGRVQPGSNFSASVNLRLRYSGGITTDLFLLASFLTNTGLFRFQQTAIAAAQAFTSGVTSDPRGKDCEMSTGANVTGGGPACPCTVWMLYTRLLSTF